MPPRTFLLLAIPLLAGSSLAQELPGGRDFLTDYEIDVLRDRQDLKGRIEAYVKFATLRLELVEQTLAKEEAGRGATIHRNLKEYSSIIEAIDDVIDDALARNRNMEDALGNLLETEKAFSVRLAGLAGEPADDAWRYEFALEDAISITQDSMELLAEDLGDRKRAVVARDEAEERRLKESMSPTRRKEHEQQGETERSAERERKRPTLLKPGEKLDGKK